VHDNQANKRLNSNSALQFPKTAGRIKNSKFHLAEAYQLAAASICKTGVGSYWTAPGTGDGRMSESD